MESRGKLGELQNGFREGRRTSDNLFTLTQLIEACRGDKEHLVVAFLDIKKAYDMVDRDILWERMAKLEIPDDFVRIVKSIYFNCGYVFQLGRVQTEKISSHRGLKQGCPFSSLLWIIYMRVLEDRLMESGFGVKFENCTDKNGKWCTIPGLMFADDIMLMEDSGERLQYLLDITATFGEESKLNFCREKSKFMVFSGSEDKTELKLGKETIERTSNYTYLGITLTDKQDYLDEERTIRLKKVGRSVGAIKNKGIYSYNKYEVIRILWKCVAVPVATYADEVLVLEGKNEKQIRKPLEKVQLNLGRIALGANKFSPNVGIQGDIGWSTFEVRETGSKLGFWSRLLKMESSKVVKQVFEYLKWKGGKTKWFRRVHFLRRKYEIYDQEQGANGVKNKVKEKAQSLWKEETCKLRSLNGIYSRKEKYSKVNYANNKKGSALLFKARVGSLETNKRMRHIWKNSPICDLCGDEEDETVGHVILECDRFWRERTSWIWPEGSDSWETDDRLCWRIGLPVNDMFADVRVTEETKLLLEAWAKEKANIDRDHTVGHRGGQAASPPEDLTVALLDDHIYARRLSDL
jgi:sorting nexin-29